MSRAGCAAALLRRGGEGCGGLGGARGRLRAAAPRCPARGRCPAGAAAPLRRRAAPPRRCRLPALGRSARMQAGRGASGAVAVGGRGVWAGGSHPPQAPATRPPHPPPLTRACACGAAAACQPDKTTALHNAAFHKHAPCVELLLKAGADASLKDDVSDGAEGRGGRRGGFGARGGAGVGGGALLTSAAPPLRAAQPPPLFPRNGRLHVFPPPSPSQRGRTALDDAKKYGGTEVVTVLEKYTPAYVAAQVGRAAPQPATPPPRPCGLCDRAWSRMPGCSLTQRPHALSPYHSKPKHAVSQNGHAMHLHTRICIYSYMHMHTYMHMHIDAYSHQ